MNLKIMIASEKAKTEWRKELKRLIKLTVTSELEYQDVNLDITYEITHFACTKNFWLIYNPDTGEAYKFDEYFDVVSQKEKNDWLQDQIETWNEEYFRLTAIFRHDEYHGAAK